MGTMALDSNIAFGVFVEHEKIPKELDYASDNLEQLYDNPKIKTECWYGKGLLLYLNGTLQHHFIDNYGFKCTQLTSLSDIYLSTNMERILDAFGQVFNKLGITKPAFPQWLFISNLDGPC